MAGNWCFADTHADGEVAPVAVIGRDRDRIGGFDPKPISRTEERDLGMHWRPNGDDAFPDRTRASPVQSLP